MQAHDLLDTYKSCNQLLNMFVFLFLFLFFWSEPNQLKFNDFGPNVVCFPSLLEDWKPSKSLHFELSIFLISFFAEKGVISPIKKQTLIDNQAQIYNSVFFGVKFHHLKNMISTYTKDFLWKTIPKIIRFWKNEILNEFAHFWKSYLLNND